MNRGLLELFKNSQPENMVRSFGNQSGVELQQSNKMAVINRAQGMFIEIGLAS